MKAVKFDGDTLVFDSDFEPKPDESIIKVDLAGICGTDLEILKGYMDYHGVLGHEFVGTVKSSENPSLIGKRVVGEINASCGSCDSCARGLERHCPTRTVLGILNRSGAFAEYLSLPAKNLHVIPDSVSDEEAVFVEPLAAAFEIKEQIAIKQDWKIAVVGDGRLAQLIVMVLNMSSKNITCFGHHQSKLQRLERLGVPTKNNIETSDKYDFDLVIEATGSSSGFEDALNIVKPRGTVILKSTITSRKNLDLTATIVNEITVIGSRCGPFRPAIEALASGIISVKDLVDSIYPLTEFTKAVEQAKKPQTMKVLLRP